jgi:mannose-1-phosphate guanylyltransferase
MKAVILAAGLGTRLQPYTFLIPKPMLPLGNKPLLEHIIEWLKESKKTDQIVLCVSYLHTIIEDYFEDGKRFGIKIEYSKTPIPMGTAGQLKAAEKLLDKDDIFICLYSDHIYDFSLDKMIKQHVKSDALVTIALLPYKIRLKYGLIDIDEEDEYKKEKTYSVESSSNSKVYQNYKNIIGWREKPEISGSINIGCYVLKPEFLEFIPKSVTFRMDDAVRKVLLLSEDQKRLVKGFTIQSSTNFVDIGDKQSYLNVHREYVRKLGRI